MKIERIKNYNQKLLAVLGTIAILFALIGLIAFSLFIIDEISRNSFDDTNTGILTNEKIEELQKENKREQVISYENPKLIDTINSIYIIPISHKTLNEKEDINVNGLLDMYSGSGKLSKSDHRYSNRFYGEFNNVIIYDQNSDINKKLFNKRVNFDKIDAEYFSDDILILIKVAEKDTHKDGVINLIDYNSLYVYSINKNKLSKIGIDEMDVYNYKFLNNSKSLIIRFGVDKNKNGKYEDYNEPTIIKKYDYKTGELIDIVDKEIDSGLQKMLEGTIQ